jgi:agmatinase
MPGAEGRQPLQRLEDAVQAVAEAGAVPVILGGDHTITWPDVTGVARALGWGRISVIHFDAHADTGELQFGSLVGHGLPMRRLIESGACRGDRFLQLGLRGYWPEPETLGWMAGQGMRSYEMHEIVHRGLVVCLEEAFAIATDDCDGVFVSVDIDVADPGSAPGTGTPEPGGFTPRELLDTVRRIAIELPVVGDGPGGGVAAVRHLRRDRVPGEPGRAGDALGDRVPAARRPVGRHLADPAAQTVTACWPGPPPLIDDGLSTGVVDHGNSGR